MKAIDDNLSGGEDRRFDLLVDLLVDGELGEAERRELLASLDHEPGGWRRCALAFLEAQCWQQEFGTMAGQRRPSEPARAKPVGAKPARQQPMRRSLGSRGTVMAMAASFLLALALGTTMQPVFRSRGARARPPGEAVAVNENTGAAAPRSDGLQPRPRIATPTNVAQAQKPSASAGPVQLVTLTLPGGPQGVDKSIQVPVVERPNVDDAWLQSLPAALPPDVLQALQRTGYRVVQRRELVPVQLNDGRRLVVPVDRVELHYVGNSTY